MCASLFRTPSFTAPTRVAARNLNTAAVYLTPDSRSRTVLFRGLALDFLTEGRKVGEPPRGKD